MKCQDFLKLIWPDQGWFCIMTNYIKQDGKVGRRHRVFDNHLDAYLHGRVEMATTDVYFGLHTHIDEKVWDTKYQTMRPSRRQENMASCRCYFLDFDVGKSEPDKPKYATQELALAALALFVFRTGLPWPFVVSSGNGLHVYWPLMTAMDSAQWRVHALNLKMLLDHHKILYDPSRVVDTTSVLRLPSTWNYKDPDNLKPVKILFEGDVTDTTVMNDQLATLTAGMQPIAATRIPLTNSSYVNIVPNTLGFPVTEADDVATYCEQMRIFRDSKGVIPEHHWYAGLGVLAYCNNGDAIAHQWSSGYVGYTFDETQAKLDQWRSRASVTGCGKFAVDGAIGVCQKCRFFGGQYKNPIVITNKAPVAASAQFVQPTTAPATFVIPGAFCDPPWPYRRIASLGVEREDSKGKWVPLIPSYDLYPVSVSAGIILNLKINQGVSTWVAREHGQHGVTSSIVEVPNGALSDPKVMAGCFSPHAVFINFSAEVLRYMSAYLQALKAAQGVRAQNNHLGWPSLEDTTRFIMNGYEIDSSGSIMPCVMSGEVDIVTMTMRKAGTLQGQLDTLEFYNHPSYFPFQHAVLASLSSPLFIATGHHGVVVNLTGPSGCGKTMALKAAGAVWGDPSHYVISGTDQGMTVNARNKRAMAIPNHPICLDEITHAAANAMRDFVMTATQGQIKTTLTANRQVREQPTGFRAGKFIASSNSSLHEIVNAEDGRAGTANSARIQEVPCDHAMLIHTKEQGDDQLNAILHNYGHIGELFMQAVMPCIDQHFKLVRRLDAYLTKRTKAKFHERYIIADAASNIAAGILARHAGLIRWDIEAYADWFCNEQLQQFRARMGMQTAAVSPENMLRDFIAQNAINTIRTDATANITPPQNIREQVVIHYATDIKEMWVQITAFKTWCNKRGLDTQRTINQLHRLGVITDPLARKVLGLGTSWGTVRSQCFVVDASHPAVV